jgi:predicted PurR-regulated permease PerM
MKQFFLILIFVQIILITKAYNLRNLNSNRNTNESENRIESNYSNVLLENEQNNEEKNKQAEKVVEKNDQQLNTLKDIIQSLVKK